MRHLALSELAYLIKKNKKTQLPCKMMEGMRLRFVPCAVNIIPSHFVVNVISTIELSVLTYAFVGTRLFIGHNTCHMCWGSGIHSCGLMLCAVRFVGKSLVLIRVCLEEAKGGL